MELEAQTVIDVEAQPIDSSFPESNEQWYSAQQMMNLLRLSKTDLQKSISKLQSIYGLNLATLRLLRISRNASSCSRNRLTKTRNT